MRAGWNLISNFRDRKSGKYIRVYYLQSCGARLMFEGLEINFTTNYFGFKVTTKRYKTDHYYKYLLRGEDNGELLEIHLFKKDDKELCLLTCKVGGQWGVTELYKAKLDRIREGDFVIRTKSEGVSFLTPETIYGEIFTHGKIDLLPLDIFLTKFAKNLNWILQPSEGGEYVNQK